MKCVRFMLLWLARTTRSMLPMHFRLSKAFDLTGFWTVAVGCSNLISADIKHVHIPCPDVESVELLQTFD